MHANIALALVLLSSTVLSSEKCNINNIKDFYNRVKSRSPLLNEAVKKKEEASSSLDIAKQRPNPELDLEYLKGDEFGLDVNTLSVTAKHVIEFGSKRDKRISKAKSYTKLRNAQIEMSLFNSNLNASIGYQRVAQLNVTIESVKEAIQTFDRITRKLSSRKRLNPEETISLSTLRLASNDYKAQLNDLENEKTLLLGKISFLSSCSKVNPKYYYLNYKKIKLNTTEDKNVGLLNLENLKVDLELGELDVQRSLGYSNISVGPTVEYLGQGNDEFISAGVALTFDLPLFQTNDGGKLNALKKLSAQKVESENQKTMLKIEKENLTVKFKRSLNTLSKMPKLEELESGHRKVEKLFSRGVVSISMTIESHRQQIEFLKSRFETENDVLSTYGKIILIDGNISAFEELL